MEIGGSAGESAKRIVELEFQCMKLNLENNNLKEEVMEVKGKEEKMMKKYEKVKDKFVKVTEKWNSDKMKWSEEEEKIREECRQVEAEKKKLEIDLKDAINNGSDGVAEISLMAKVEHYKSLSEDSGCTITALSAKNKALEAQMAVEVKKLKMEEEKILELAQKIKALEREKGEMEAEFCKMNEDKRNEAEKRVHENKLFESAKNIIETSMKKINELVNSAAASERVNEAEKRAMEDVGKKKVSELTHKIEVLERENKEMEAKFCLLNSKQIEEFKRISDESKKKVSERIEALEREIRELEAEARRANRERSEEIKKILNEKTSLQEKHVTEISNLVSRSGILEREKRELEAEVRERDVKMKLLVQEKEYLVAKAKIMEIKTNWRTVKSEVDVELPQLVLPARNVAISSSLAAQNQGQKHVDVKSEDIMTSANACKSKQLLVEHSTEGRSCWDVVALGRYGNSPIAKRLRSSIEKS